MINLSETIKTVAFDNGVLFLNHYTPRVPDGKGCIAISGTLSELMGVITEVTKGLHALGDEAFLEGRAALTSFERYTSPDKEIVFYWPDLEPIVEA